MDGQDPARHCDSVEPHEAHEHEGHRCPGIVSSPSLINAIAIRNSAMKYLESREELLAEVARRHRRPA